MIIQSMWYLYMAGQFELMSFWAVEEAAPFVLVMAPDDGDGCGKMVNRRSLDSIFLAGTFTAGISSHVRGSRIVSPC